MTQEELHLQAAAYANRRKKAHYNSVKKGLKEKLSKEMINWIWMAHYEGYYEGYYERYREAIQAKEQA